MKTILNLIILSGISLSCLLGCEAHEDRIQNSNQHHKNSTSTFIYNVIPEGGHAEISVEYSAAINTFSINLLKTVYSNSEYLNKNVILSPFSVGRNLAVIAEASRGDSRQELLEALGGQKALDDAKAALTELLYADNSVVFQCADAIWVNSSKYSVIESFRSTANSKYGLEVDELNFDDASNAINTINDWIKKNTNHKIYDVLKADDLTEITAAMVTNAVYFEADWASPFDITKTQPYEFHSPDGPVMVDMMASNYYHETRKTDTYENTKLYYGSNSADYFFLDVYMPITISLQKFLQDSCLAALTQNDTTSFNQGQIKMPKFFFTTRCNLAEMLKQMGVKRIFDPLIGEITGMIQKKDGELSLFFIEKMMHEAAIKTDEEGTKAYAVTLSNIGDTSAPPDSPDVIFDRPFVYFIRAGANGLVLFAGVVNNPS